jgi:hypothetical protein
LIPDRRKKISPKRPDSSEDHPNSFYKGDAGFISTGYNGGGGQWTTLLYLVYRLRMTNFYL